MAVVEDAAGQRECKFVQMGAGAGLWGLAVVRRAGRAAEYVAYAECHDAAARLHDTL